MELIEARMSGLLHELKALKRPDDDGFPGSRIRSLPFIDAMPDRSEGCRRLRSTGADIPWVQCVLEKILLGRGLGWVGHQSGPGIILGIPTVAEELMDRGSDGAKGSVLRRQVTARQWFEVIGLRKVAPGKAVDLENRLDKVRISTPQRQQ